MAEDTPHDMTSAEFRAALKQLGIRQSWLAEKTGCTAQTINRYATGKLPVPSYMGFLFSLIRERREIAERLRH